jgi:hypothetical protein
MRTWQMQYELGKSAAYEGDSRHCNPNCWKSVDWYAWEVGFTDAEQEINAVFAELEAGICEAVQGL